MSASKELSAKNAEYAIAIRRDLHMYPEISGQETETVNKICEKLKELGLTPEIIGGNNVVAKIEGRSHDKRVAIRADIDALPVTEEAQVPFKSKKLGAMHACGHDAHTAILLATAKSLVEIKAELCGDIYLCFQAEEETNGGASKIVEYLKQKGGVDLVFGTHIHAATPVGVIAIPTGAMMSGACGWEIRVHGKGGHSSRPDQSINALLACADIALKVAAIPANRHAAFDVCVVTPTIMQSGAVSNIIPEEAFLRGGVRFYKKGEQNEILDVIEQIASDTAKVYGASAETIRTNKYTPPVVNDRASANFALETVETMPNLKSFFLDKPDTGSDNFGTFLESFKGFYCIIGARSNNEWASHVHHSARFDIDEGAIAVATEFFVEHARRYLKEAK